MSNYQPTGTPFHYSDPPLHLSPNVLTPTTEHDGLKQDGTPDKRVGTGEFAHGKVDPHQAGQEGGKTGGSTGGSASGGGDGGQHKPTENNGLKQDGTPDGRVKGN